LVAQHQFIQYTKYKYKVKTIEKNIK